MRQILWGVIMCFSIANMAQVPVGDFSIAPRDIVYAMDAEFIEDGVEVCTFSFEVDSCTHPITITWEVPSQGAYTYWTTNGTGFLKPSWKSDLIHSKTASEAPVVCLCNNDNQNVLTFALSDALNDVLLKSGVNEKTSRLVNSIVVQPSAFIDQSIYKVRLRIDRRVIPYWSTLKAMSQWWAAFEGFEIASVPDMARYPMYSTWYSFHQNMSVDVVIENCKAARACGCRSVIMDDGWQTNDGKGGYRHTGDWKAERFLDMKALVDSIHNIGMNFLLWYSVPFVGEAAEVYEHFQPYLLNYSAQRGVGVLDPRYPEVRAYLIAQYVDAVKDWGVDGLKLDFVDKFTNESPYRPGMDYQNVNAAVDRLLGDVRDSLFTINSEFMIEFRQHYIGPLMRKYGNMFRASDCPYSLNYNRDRITRLRLLSGHTAVHSDMLMWNAEESDESAALQLLNVFFSVPQISVRLDIYPNSHIEMLSFWLDFWTKHRALILDGDFKAFWPNANYPLLLSESADELIAAVYQSQVVVDLDQIDQKSNIYVINAKEDETIYVNCPQARDVRVLIYDCQGHIVQSYVKTISKLETFQVPRSGMIEFRSEMK